MDMQFDPQEWLQSKADELATLFESGVRRVEMKIDGKIVAIIDKDGAADLVIENWRTSIGPR